MVQSHPNIIAGRTLAVVATLSWALNSIAPYVTAADRIFGSITAPKA
jgi:predicted ABC-type exoprotein transport system permease subunit